MTVVNEQIDLTFKSEDANLAPSAGQKAGGAGAPAATTPAAKIVGDFLSKVEADKGKDAGKRPGLARRSAIGTQRGSVALFSSVGALMIGKDYELSRRMLDHYLTADGDPLVYSPPQAVQDAITKKFPSPGHFVEVSGFGSWSTPDIRNGLGHFNLDVVKTDEGLTYFVSAYMSSLTRLTARSSGTGFRSGSCRRKASTQ